MNEPEVPIMTVTELRQYLDTGERVVLLDVREPFEWQISNLAQHGARLMPMGEVPSRVGELDRSDPVVVYCRTGARSGMIARYLILNGFERVWNLEGGINAWAHSEDP